MVLFSFERIRDSNLGRVVQILAQLHSANIHFKVQN